MRRTARVDIHESTIRKLQREKVVWSPWVSDTLDKWAGKRAKVSIPATMTLAGEPKNYVAVTPRAAEEVKKFSREQRIAEHYVVEHVVRLAMRTRAKHNRIGISVQTVDLILANGGNEDRLAEVVIPALQLWMSFHLEAEDADIEDLSRSCMYDATVNVGHTLAGHVRRACRNVGWTQPALVHATVKRMYEDSREHKLDLNSLTW